MNFPVINKKEETVRLTRRQVVACALASGASAVSAQETFPTRPIKLVVAYPAGGVTDNVARIIAQGMSTHLAQPVVVENKPGAAGLLGHSYVASQPGDGYTLLIGAGGAMTINVQMQEKPPYHPERDFTPISQLVASDAVLVVGKAFPANDLKQFVSVVKAAPDKYSYASAGTGNPTHLGMELFKSSAGLKATHVPFKGDKPAVMAVMAGHVGMMVGVYASVAELIRSKEVKVIASFGSRSVPSMDNVPTIAEQGYPDVKSMIWLGLLGPKGLPVAVRDKLNAVVRAVLEDPATRAKIEHAGSDVRYSTPQELRDLVSTEYVKWGRVIKDANIKSE